MTERDKPTRGASRQKLYGGGVPLRPLLKQKGESETKKRNQDGKSRAENQKWSENPLNSIYTIYPIVNPLKP